VRLLPPSPTPLFRSAVHILYSVYLNLVEGGVIKILRVNFTWYSLFWNWRLTCLIFIHYLYSEIIGFGFDRISLRKTEVFLYWVKLQACHIDRISFELGRLPYPCHSCTHLPSAKLFRWKVHAAKILYMICMRYAFHRAKYLTRSSNWNL